MTYTIATLRKVEGFLREHRLCSKYELQRLGTDGLRVKYQSLNAILFDLEQEHKIVYVNVRFGKRRIKKIQWKG